MARRPILLLLACLLFPSEIRAAVFSEVHQGFTSSVISILDSGTLEVLQNNHADRVRRSGIDCFEKGQAHSTRAKQTVSAFVFGRDVILQIHGQDTHGRTLADVLLPDGTNGNHTLVKDGWCLWYRKYAPGDTVLEGMEMEAREGRKGLWLIRPCSTRRFDGDRAQTR